MDDGVMSQDQLENVLLVGLYDLQQGINALGELCRTSSPDLGPVLASLSRLEEASARPRPRPPLWQVCAGWAALFAGGLVFGVLATLVASPSASGRSTRLLERLDRVVVTEYKALPKGVRGQLDRIYLELGAKSPGQRQGE